MQNNLNTKSQNHRHPEPSLRHPERSEGSPQASTETLHSLRSLRVTGVCHPERSEGSQETKNTHINIGTGEDIGIKELTDPSKLHALGWKHKVEFSDGIKTMYEWYLNNK